MLRSRRKVTCFYCSTKLSSPPEDPNDFTCTSCSSRNRYDPKTGEILSSDPAMFDTEANKSSFARRAHQPKSKLPSTFESTLFCHTCRTNQTLFTNLLANYLPPADDPNYATAMARLPAYKASLEVRYPLVCRNCLPAVQERIKQKEHFARSQAFGGWLETNRSGQRPALSRVPSITKGDREKPWEIWLWRIQGILYVLNTTWTVVSYLAGMRGRSPRFLRTPPPFVVLLSLLWLFFDRTAAEVRTSQRKGIDLRVKGRERFIQIQLALWLSRLVASTLISVWGTKVTEGTFGALLAMEFVLAIFGWRVMRITRLAPITLSRHASASEAQPQTPPDSLSMSPSDTLISTKSASPNPVFGLPSLVSSLPPAAELTSSYLQDEMDWVPVVGDPSLREDDPFLLSPQRFPGPPTGLESLFASASLDGSDAVFGNISTGLHTQQEVGLWNTLRRRQGVLIIALLTTVIVLLVAVLLQTQWRNSQWEAAWEWEQRQRQSETVGGLPWGSYGGNEFTNPVDL